VGLGLLSKAPNPILKLVGWVIVLGLFGLSSVGLAGIATAAAERIKAMSPEMTPYSAFSRGAGFLIIGCVFPIVGWLGFTPILLLISIGAGLRAVRTKAENGTPVSMMEAV
jgi:hypothetical protein